MIHFQVRHLMGVLECHQLIPVPITTKKKRYSRLSVVTPFQLRPEKKDTVVWPSFVAPFQLPLLRRSNYDRKKRYTRLSVVTPFQLRPEKKDTVVWPSFVAPFQLPLFTYVSRGRLGRNAIFAKEFNTTVNRHILTT